MSLAVLMLLACTDPSSSVDGTAVGNPGKLDFTGTDVPTDVSLSVVQLHVVAVTVEPCGAEGVHTQLDLSLDLLALPTWPVTLDADTYCSVVAELDGATIVGETAGGTTFSLALTPDDLVVEQVFTVDGDALLLGLPLPIDAAVLEELGEDVELGSEDDVTEGLAQDISSGVTLGQDDDGDGMLTALDSGPEAGDTAGSQACGGCSGRPGSAGLWWLLAALAALCRRVRPRPTASSGTDPAAPRRSPAR